MRAVPVLSRRELTLSRFVLSVAVFAAGPAAALCPAPELKVCSVYFDSDKVFYGRVVKVTPIGFDGGAPGPDDLIAKNRYTIAVQQSFKGKVGATEDVVTDNDSGRWYSEVGERRVVFARNGHVRGLCSRIDEAAHAGETIARIKGLATASDATIEGRVLSTHGGKPIAGRDVIAFGTNVRYEAVTRRDGSFVMRVPPGRYRLDATLHSSDYSYQHDLQGFDVAHGQCAQFDLMPAGQ